MLWTSLVGFRPGIPSRWNSTAAPRVRGPNRQATHARSRCQQCDPLRRSLCSALLSGRSAADGSKPPARAEGRFTGSRQGLTDRWATSAPCLCLPRHPCFFLLAARSAISCLILSAASFGSYGFGIGPESHSSATASLARDTLPVRITSIPGRFALSHCDS